MQCWKIPQNLEITYKDSGWWHLTSIEVTIKSVLLFGTEAKDEKLFLKTAKITTEKSSDEYIFKIKNLGRQFKITLVWTDPPTSITAQQQLVNNLDLVVFHNNTQYFANG